MDRGQSLRAESGTPPSSPCRRLAPRSPGHGGRKHGVTRVGRATGWMRRPRELQRTRSACCATGRPPIRRRLAHASAVCDRSRSLRFRVPGSRGRHAAYRWAAWIPDFQHHHMPGMFAPRERAANELFRMARADCTHRRTEQSRHETRLRNAIPRRRHTDLRSAFRDVPRRGHLFG